VGVAHPEGEGDGQLQLHPDARHIEDEMVHWAETHLATSASADAPSTVGFHVLDYDTPRRRLLERRGYERLAGGGMHRRLRLGNRRVPRPQVADGYTIRSTRPGDESDHARMAAVLNAGFGRTVHTAIEYQTFAAESPSFEPELNLVAVAPDGSFAAHVGCTFDALNQRGIFEPVCTHADHRRRGLALALMVEGLNRLRRIGAVDVYVETGDRVAANALYEAAGFTEAYRGHYWRKTSSGGRPSESPDAPALDSADGRASDSPNADAS